MRYNEYEQEKTQTRAMCLFVFKSYKIEHDKKNCTSCTGVRKTQKLNNIDHAIKQ